MNKLPRPAATIQPLSMMRRHLPLLMAGLLLSACGAIGGRNPARVRGGFDDALAFKNQGEYAEAAELFEEMARLGGGWEVAQFHLGECKLALSAQAIDQSSRQQLRNEAFFWIHLAAHSGNAEAQGRLAEFYWKAIGTPKKRVDAGKFLVLYEHNPSKRAFGLNIVSRELAQDIRKGLSEDEMAQAEVLASAFVPVRQPARLAKPVQDKGNRKPNPLLEQGVPGVNPDYEGGL